METREDRFMHLVDEQDDLPVVGAETITGLVPGVWIHI